MTTQLPPQGPPEPDEKLPGEVELAALYRQLPQSEPSPALDAAVLHAAAQALVPDEETSAIPRERRKTARERGDWVYPKQGVAPAVGPSSARRSRKRPRWLIALSSAATLVLVAGLAWHMRGLPPTESAPTSADSVAPALAAAPRVAPANTPMPPAEPASPMSLRQPPPSMVAKESPTPTVTTLHKAATGKHVTRASVESYTAGALPQPAPANVDAPATPPMIVPQVASNSAANTAKPTLDEAAPVARRMQTRMPLAPTPIAAATAETDTTSYASDTPAQELGKIRQLFALGRDDEARQRLTAFHLAHPRWDLPLDLQTQLRKP